MSASICPWRVPGRTDCAPARRAHRIRIAVAVADDAFGRLEEIASACGAIGFRHDSTLTSVGVITGSITLTRLRTLRAVPGVVAVAIERPPWPSPIERRG